MDWPDAAAERLISTQFQVWTEHARRPGRRGRRAPAAGRSTSLAGGRRRPRRHRAGYRVAEVVARFGGTAAAPTA
ncbi:MAG TPA: hypothetical protein VH307_17335 [Streptosporangiaceae bacterium]|nr:hypothetical protein [Streptosporangiaceae bacterium]